MDEVFEAEPDIGNKDIALETGEGSVVDSSEDLFDGQAEDMLEDLHNLLFLHGPQPQGADGGAAGEAGASLLVEDLEREQQNVVVEEDSLPPEFCYLREINYNQPF